MYEKIRVFEKMKLVAIAVHSLISLHREQSRFNVYWMKEGEVCVKLQIH